MGTRGVYGIRKNGEDKLTYNHWDSYPDGLGRDILEFCSLVSVKNLNRFWDKLILVNENDNPTPDQIEFCKKHGMCDFNVSSRSETDWYCLLRNLQGNFEKYRELLNDDEVKEIYMTNSNNFIKDSLFCEYGYIINLDEEVLEFWDGFQRVPNENNRYGTEMIEDDYGYYPCKLMVTFPLNEIYNNRQIHDYVNIMNSLDE